MAINHCGVNAMFRNKQHLATLSVLGFGCVLISGSSVNAQTRKHHQRGLSGDQINKLLRQNSGNQYSFAMTIDSKNNEYIIANHKKGVKGAEKKAFKACRNARIGDCYGILSGNYRYIAVARVADKSGKFLQTLNKKPAPVGQAKSFISLFDVIDGAIRQCQKNLGKKLSDQYTCEPQIVIDQGQRVRYGFTGKNGEALAVSDRKEY